jgi:hypothetical protein
LATPSPEATARWERLVERVLAAGDATYGSGASGRVDGAQRTFGSTSLKTAGKIFTMLVRDRLVVKLPAARVTALIAAGEGSGFDPGHGRIQKEWLDVAGDDEDRWLELALESEAFVAKRKR